MIMGAKPRDHTEPMFPKLELLKFVDIDKYLLASLSYCKDSWCVFDCFKRIQDFHHYATRSSSGSHVMQVNTLRPRQNGRRFADDTFKCILLNENVRILIKISLKFVPKGPINNNPALVQIMAWRWSGDKPLSEPIMVSLLTHICVTRPQWVKTALGKTDISYIGPIIWNKVLSVALILTHRSWHLRMCVLKVSQNVY